MKTLIATTIALMILLSVSMNAVAQVRVTGHVFAEVVELTGAERNTNEYISLSATEAVSGFDLGEITFRGKANTTFEVMISSSSLTGDNGAEAFFETSQTASTNTLDNSGNQSIKLKGTTGEDLYTSGNKQFAGNYNVVLAYN